MAIIAPDIGIDLGTSNTLVHVRRRGIQINEPTLLVVSGTEKRTIKAIGQDALALVGSITLPALVIHGEQDTIVPLSVARTLYDGLGSPEKQLLTIPDADHNTIIFAHPQLYFGAISEFIAQTAR